jgi:hypothetical protein
VTDADESTADLPPADGDDDDIDVKEGIRDRSVREVVERTRDVIRKTRELLESSRDLLDRVRNRDGADDDDAAKSDADGDAPGEHDADEGSDDHAGVDARPVDGRE